MLLDNHLTKDIVYYMPNIKDKSTIQAIAREYTTNGRNKTQALLSVGYSPNYVDSSVDKVWGNVGLNKVIARIDAKGAKLAGFSVEQAQQEYEEARQVAITTNQPAAMVSATTGKARLFGMDKDASSKNDTPKSLSEKDLQSARDEVKRLNLLKLRRNTA